MRTRAHSLNSLKSDLRYFMKREDNIVCCETSNWYDCFQNASAEFIPLFLKSCVAKMLLELFAKRSLKHLWQQMSYEVPRFGLSIGLVSSIYMGVMCCLRRTLGKKINRKRAMAFAAFLSAIPIVVGLNKKELSLFKLLIYPLMYRCLVTKLIELGLIPTFKHGDILGYVVTTFFYGFCQICESHSHQPQMYNMVKQYAQFGYNELLLFTSWKIRYRADLNDKYLH